MFFFWLWNSPNIGIYKIQTGGAGHASEREREMWEAGLRWGSSAKSPLYTIILWLEKDTNTQIYLEQYLCPFPSKMDTSQAFKAPFLLKWQNLYEVQA